jgi:hypothetical protein
MESLRVEAPRAVPDELLRQSVDARQSRELVRSDGREAAVEPGWEIVSDVAGRRRDRVEVVEQPFGRGGRRLTPPRVVGQVDIHAAQHAHVLVESVEMWLSADATARADGEKRRQAARVLLQGLDAQ